MATSVTRRPASALLSPFSSVLLLFLSASQARLAAGKAGYGQNNAGLGGYHAQDRRVPTRLWMKPHKLPSTGPCGYMSRCTSCQDACPPPPGGCNKPSPVPTVGKNPTNCCPRWKCDQTNGDSNTCKHNGEIIPVGGYYEDPCVQKCICKNGGFFECNPICTLTVQPWNCKNARQVKKQGQCCHEWECDPVTCTFKGETDIPVGRIVDQGCEGKCVCGESGMMYCAPYCPQMRALPSAGCPNPKLINGGNWGRTPVINAANCCDRWKCEFRTIDRFCMYKGVRYEDGQSFGDGCDWNCKCYAGKISCSSKCVVSLVPPENTCIETEHFKTEGECCHHWRCCHRPTYCYDNGRRIPQGEVFFKGCDSRCVCTSNGQIHCISRCPTLVERDPSPECPYPKKIKGKDGCCDLYVCMNRVPCIDRNGKQHEDEAIFNDGCDICYCRAGNVLCTRRCPPTLEPPGSNGCAVTKIPSPEDPECCEVYTCKPNPKMCVFEKTGIQYVDGDRWIDGCLQRCLCNNGVVECINYCPETHVRPSTSCPNPVKVTKPGVCCPIWECPCDDVCKWKGKEYPDNHEWTEGCDKRCRCVGGVVDCVSLCPPIQVIKSVQCANPEKIQLDDCCPIYQCRPPVPPIPPTPCPPCQRQPCPTNCQPGNPCPPQGCDPAPRPCPPCPREPKTPKCTYPIQVKPQGACCPQWKCVQYY